MFLELLGDEELLRDFQLLVLEIAGQTDHLHPIQKRWRNGLHHIGGGEKHDLRQIEIHLEVMIVERAVLLRIEHLEQGRRGIAPEVHAHLIHLVEKEYGIFGLGAPDGLDDPPRHRADVRAPVPPDLRLVPHAAEGHLDELAIERARHRFPQRSFSRARRPHETQDRPLDLLDEIQHREVFHDALLRLLQSMMILVQDLLRGRQVQIILRLLLPRQRDQPVEIIANHRGFRRHRIHLLQPVQFGVGLLPHLLRHLRLFDLFLQLGDLVGDIPFFAQFLPNGLDLFVEVELPLILLNGAAHRNIYLLLDLQNLPLGREDTNHLIELFVQIESLQDLLFDGGLLHNIRRNRIRETPGSLQIAHGHQHLVRNLTIELDVFRKIIHQFSQMRIQIRRRGHLFRHHLYVRLQKGLPPDETRHAGARQSFKKHPEHPVGQLEHLHNSRDHTDPIQILRFWFILRGIFLEQ